VKDGQKYIVVSFLISEEDGQYAAHCLELDTVSCGETFEKARAALEEAVLLDINTLEAIGERARFFRERKIRMRTYHAPGQEPRPRTVTRPIPAGAWATRQLVPVPA